MRFVETLTKSVDDRLAASTKKHLHQKVANSKRPKHRGYPDETGYVPSIIVDPSHNSQFDMHSNICRDKDSVKTTVYTACLTFPHLPIAKHVKSGFSMKKLTSYACVDSHSVLSKSTDETEEVLRERERLRMNAIKTGHEYNLDSDKVLTSDSEEKILINAYRKADKNTTGEPSVKDVSEVISYKRNKFDRFLSFSMDDVTEEMLSELVTTKTCAPIIPANDNQKQVLLYWIDNPNASLAEVIEETGISRGKFETFRLNLPDVSCYSRSYIESLSFDTGEMVATLRRNMISSPHDVYNCSECEKWAYSKMALAGHKNHSEDHDVNHVTHKEDPNKNTESTESIDDNWGGEVMVDDMLKQFESSGEETVEKEVTTETDTEETIEPVRTSEYKDIDKNLVTYEQYDTEDIVDLSESLCESRMFSMSVICNALGESEGEILNRITANLTESEKEKVLVELNK
jgi:hypothetical protein